MKRESNIAKRKAKAKSISQVASPTVGSHDEEPFVFLPDPWTWAALPLLAAMDQYLAYDEINRVGLDSELRGVFLYGAVMLCLDLKPSVDSGNGSSVLRCVDLCGRHKLVMPDWLALAFHKRFQAVNQLEAKSWDDPKAFGNPYPKGTHRIALRNKLEKSYWVWSMVVEAVADGHAVDTELFDAISERLSNGGHKVGKALAQEYYKFALGRGLFNPTKDKLAFEHRPRWTQPLEFDKSNGIFPGGLEY